MSIRARLTRLEKAAGTREPTHDPAWHDRRLDAARQWLASSSMSAAEAIKGRVALPPGVTRPALVVAEEMGRLAAAERPEDAEARAEGYRADAERYRRQGDSLEARIAGTLVNLWEMRARELRGAA